ncbi:MAG: hypothetical protein ABSG22_06175 [Sedimentisphaerales bacterium]
MEGSAVRAPDTTSNHADPSFRPRREPSNRSGLSPFIRWSPKPTISLEAGRGVDARFL